MKHDEWYGREGLWHNEGTDDNGRERLSPVERLGPDRLRCLVCKVTLERTGETEHLFSYMDELQAALEAIGRAEDAAAAYELEIQEELARGTKPGQWRVDHLVSLLELTREDLAEAEEMFQNHFGPLL